MPLKCRKRWFKTKEEADKALADLQVVRNGSTSTFNPQHVEQRSYFCEHCGKFHLTSQSLPRSLS